jgi:hypothetical protein
MPEIDPPQHTYPSEYPRGKHWALDVAWSGLDLIRPGLIPEDVRALLAGYFFAALTTAAEQGKISEDKIGEFRRNLFARMDGSRE